MLKSEHPHILFLNNAAGIWIHTASDVLVMNHLRQNGFSVSTLACGGYVKGLCAVRRSRNRELVLTEKKARLDCLDCVFTEKLVSCAVNHGSGSKSLSGNSLLGVEDFELASRIVESWKLSENIETASFRGIPVARLAGYEVSLKYKSWTEATEGKGRAEYLKAIEDCILTVTLAHRALEELGGLDGVVVRSPHYANNHAFSLVALGRGLKVWLMDGSSNLSEDYTHMNLWDWGKYLSSNPALLYFTESYPDPAASEIKRIERHFQALRHGSSHKVYSTPKVDSKTALEALGATPGIPTALLALSSTDESVAAVKAGVNPSIKYPGVVFADQFIWVSETIEWFRERSHLQCVIRIHPREFPNKREGLTSEAGLKWEKLLHLLPPNVFLNHPFDSLSIYDLLGEVSVVVTGWSTVGVEAAMLDVPILTYDSTLPTFPASIGMTGRSKEAYFSNLSIAMEGDSGIEFKRNATRWLHLLMNLGTARVGGRFLAKRQNFLPLWLRFALEGCDRFLFFLFRPIDLLRALLIEKIDHRILSVFKSEQDSLVRDALL